MGVVREGLIRVLHVDDDEGFLECSKELLRMQGDFEVTDVVGVDDAIELLRSDCFDVVVSDYEMPEKSGLDFLELLKSENSLLPFILFTGKGREEIVIRALNLGVDGYFSKVGDPETVYGELAFGVRRAVEKCRSKELFEASEERFRAIVTGASEGILAADPKTQKFIFANPQICKLIGYSNQDLLKMGVADIHPKKDWPFVNEQFAKQSKGEMNIVENIDKLFQIFIFL